MRNGVGYWPHPPMFLLVLLGAGALVIAFIEVRAAGYAFSLAGLSPTVAMGVLVGSLAGSAVNLPVLRLTTGELFLEYRRVRAYGVTYVVPVGVPGYTTVAVNVGGALVPADVSAYLIYRSGRWPDTLVAVAVVALVVHFAARPLPGVGIVVPTLLPAATATAISLVLGPAPDTAALAYVSGTLGTLIGADLTHLGWARHTGAPVVSIGGAGTFDGVFVSGILAVLLASFF